MDFACELIYFGCNFIDLCMLLKDTNYFKMLIQASINIKINVYCTFICDHNYLERIKFIDGLFLNLVNIVFDKNKRNLCYVIIIVWFS